MDDRTKLTLFRGIKSGALNDRQKLDAFRAIESDAANEDVVDLIGSLSFTTLGKGKTLNELVDERQGRDRERFDYSKGADGKLRSLMSFGETEGDREAILSKLVGEDGYVRDPSGQLALTQSGQEARGMEPIGKNLVIEDEGFSARDFSDFAGIVPETVGSIAGAIIGGGPSFGLGAVAGAGIGAMVGQSLEEALESFYGVQTQDFGEVARDVAIEGVIGAGGEVLGAAIIGAGRGIIGAGKNVAGRVGGRSPAEELSQERIARMQSLVDRNYLPSLEAMDAPKPFAYGQKFGENAGKVMGRIDNNTNQALIDKAKFLDGINDDAASEIGEDVVWYAPAAFAKLRKARNDAQKGIFNAVDDAMDLMSSSYDKSIPLNAQALGSITKAFQAGNENAVSNFRAIDDMLNQIQTTVTGASGRQVMKKGGQLDIFNVTPIKNQLTDYMNEMRNLADPAVDGAEVFLRGTSGGGATFNEMAILRKQINDSLYFGGSVTTKGRNILDKVRKQIDEMMDGDNIIDDIRINTTGLFAEDKILLKEAAAQRKFAMKNYREFRQKYDKLADLSIIRSVDNLQDFEGYGAREIADKFYDKVIKANSPARLQSVLDASDNPNALNDMFARRYLEDGLDFAGRNDVDPTKFDGRKFYNHVKKLGDTGRVLFGDEWGQVQRVAKDISGAHTRKGISIEDVQNATDAAGGESSIVLSMQNMLAKQNELNDALKTTVIKDINAGTYENYDSVVKALTSPNLTQSEVIKIMKFFDGNPQMKDNMKSVVLQDILSVVDDQVFASPQAASSLRDTLSGYKRGTLRQILGEDTSDALYGFADDLVDLGDVGKEGSIAAGSLWANMFKHPINTLSSIGKIKVFANVLGSKGTAQRYLQFRRAAGNNPENQSQAMINILNESLVEEGVDVGAAASKAGRIIKPITSAASQSSRAFKNVTPRAAGLGSYEKPGQTRTNVQPPLRMPSIPVPEVSMPSVSTEPMGPIQMLQRNVQSELRKRARENPAVAATLLGGLGNAGLL